MNPDDPEDDTTSGGGDRVWEQAGVVHIRRGPAFPLPEDLQIEPTPFILHLPGDLPLTVARDLVGSWLRSTITALDNQTVRYKGDTGIHVLASMVQDLNRIIANINHSIDHPDELI